MSKRILVVEDQEDNRQILRDLLTSADFEVIEAVDGEAGLAAAAAHRPDLILMDIQLPILDGYEATRRIKADAVLRAIPIIAVTSYGLAGDVRKCRFPVDGIAQHRAVRQFSPRCLGKPPPNAVPGPHKRPRTAIGTFPLPCPRKRIGGLLGAWVRWKTPRNSSSRPEEKPEPFRRWCRGKGFVSGCDG